MTTHTTGRERKRKPPGGKSGKALQKEVDNTSGTPEKRLINKQSSTGEHKLAHGQEILAGIHCVREALLAGRRRFHCIHIADDASRDRLRTIVSQSQALKIPLKPLAPEDLDTLCQGARHQGIAAIVGPLPLLRAETALPEMVNPAGATLILVLESMEDPHNLGALIRTALCAGVDHIVLPRDRSVSPTPAVSRASAGAMEHASIWSVTNTTTLLRSLKQMGFWVAGLDAQGKQSVFQADLTGNIALVVGGEHKGIRPLVKKECDFILCLPMAKGVTSLNASVAGGIAMYEILRQRGK